MRGLCQHINPRASNRSFYSLSLISEIEGTYWVVDFYSKDSSTLICSSLFCVLPRSTGRFLNPHRPLPPSVIHHRHVSASCADLVFSLSLQPVLLLPGKKQEAPQPLDMKPSSSTSSSKYHVHSPSDTVPRSHSARSRGSGSRNIGVCLSLSFLPYSLDKCFSFYHVPSALLSLELQLLRWERHDHSRCCTGAI